MEFADRYKGLAQRVMNKVNNHVSQKIHRENSDRMCLASFVAGLSGFVGRQVRYAHPRCLQEVLNYALAVDQAEKQERHNETFCSQSDDFAGQSTRSPCKKIRGRNGSELSADSRTSSQQFISSHGTRSVTQTAARKFPNSSAPRCYECEGIQHFGRECLTRLKRLEISPNSSGRKNPSEHSQRPISPSEKPRNATPNQEKE